MFGYPTNPRAKKLGEVVHCDALLLLTDQLKLMLMLQPTFTSFTSRPGHQIQIRARPPSEVLPAPVFTDLLELGIPFTLWAAKAQPYFEQMSRGMWNVNLMVDSSGFIRIHHDSSISQCGLISQICTWATMSRETTHIYTRPTVNCWIK